MKMNQTSKSIAACAGAVSIIIWLVLPIYAFVVIIPLFQITGYRLAMSFNQIAILFLFAPVLMTIAPFSGEKRYCIWAGIINCIALLILLIIKKPIVANGNLKWLFQSAGSLINGVGSALGQTITENNFSSYIQVICDNFLVGGIGLWINLILGFAYIVFVSMFSKEESTNKTSAGPIQRNIRQTQSSGSSGSSVATPPTRTSHRT